MFAAKLIRHPEMSAWQIHAFALTLGLVTGVDFISASMIATAGMHIQGGIHAGPGEYLWTLTSYAAAASIATFLLGRVAQQMSYRCFSLGSLFVFVLGSFACVVADNAFELAGARFIQGLGGGALFAASRILIQLVSRREERPTLLLGFTIGAFSLSAIAPWLTAMLVQDSNWRTVFLVQAAIALPLLPLVAITYPQRAAADAEAIDLGQLDWHAVLAFGGGTLLLLQGLAELRYYRPAATLLPALMIASGALLFVYGLLRQARHPTPWLDTGALTGRRYVAGVLFYATYYALSGLWNYVIPVYLQGGLGFNFETTGLVVTIGSLVGLVAMVLFTLAGSVMMGKRRVIGAGYLMFAASAFLMATRAMPGVSLDRLMPAILLQGITSPFMLVQVATMTYLDLGEDDFFHGYQLKNIARQIATSMGTGMTSLWMQYDIAEARTAMVGHVTAYDVPPDTAVSTLLAWSAQIDKQSTLVASENVLIAVAALCTVIAIISVSQRALR